MRENALVNSDENIRWLARRGAVAGRHRAGSGMVLALSGTVFLGLLSISVWGAGFALDSPHARPMSGLVDSETKLGPEPPLRAANEAMSSEVSAPELLPPVTTSSSAVDIAPGMGEEGETASPAEFALSTGSLPDGRVQEVSPASGSRLSQAAAGGALIVGQNTPYDCLSPELESVLADVADRFGPVTIVSTTHLHTDNHIPGSSREKAHHACRAIDFKVQARGEEVIAYLKSRREVAGINRYRNNGVIHVDAHDAPSGAEVR
jgi:hypothetical protein